MRILTTSRGLSPDSLVLIDLDKVSAAQEVAGHLLVVVDGVEVDVGMSLEDFKAHWSTWLNWTEVS